MLKPKPRNVWKGSQYEAHVPAVADRVAQTVAALALEPRTESIFHDDSFGYRPGRSPHAAVARCRERCWKRDWVIDLDIRKFLDASSHCSFADCGD
jgi:RNA-directed DNA polymerase